MTGLTLEALRTLLAVGWVDGRLDAREATTVLTIARRFGLDGDELRQLEEDCRVERRLGDPGELDAEQRMLVYALARWVIRADGQVTVEESDVLHVVAMTFGIGGRGRHALDRLVDELFVPDVAAFDPNVLVARIRAL